MKRACGIPRDALDGKEKATETHCNTHLPRVNKSGDSGGGATLFESNESVFPLCLHERLCVGVNCVSVCDRQGCMGQGRGAARRGADRYSERERKSGRGERQRE